MQSLAEQAQARTGLLWEAAYVHADAVTTHEVKLQAEVTVTCDTQRVKEVMVR
jgi:hypothetical protein